MSDSEATGGRERGTQPEATDLGATLANLADSVLIVGTGLMGTSLGLALSEESVEVWLTDRQAGRAALAAQMGAGRPFVAGVHVDIAVVAVPPSAIAEVIFDLQKLGVSETFTDLASTKTQPQLEGYALGVDFSRYVGGHPMAGRERSGPAAARADLFAGRPWVITPTSDAAPDAIASVEVLARAVGGVPVRMTASAHDEAVAATSHLPHVMSTLLAAQFAETSLDVVQIAGPGLHDTTRLAEGDPGLWTEILQSNAGPVADAVERLAHDLNVTVTHLKGMAAGDEVATQAVRDALMRGVEGRRRLPGKRGQAAAAFATIEVVVRDTPGELARLLQTVAAASVNLEDLRVEHEPGRPLGVAELEVREESAPALVMALRAGGWTVER